MKTILVALMLIIMAFAVKAQQAPPNEVVVVNDSLRIYTTVEKDPSFPGGQNKFIRFLIKNIRYPAESHEKNIQGKVILTMVVEKDGSLTDIRVIQSVAKDIDAEAIRVMKLSPKWEPGMQGGKPVRVQHNIPISFTQQQ